MSKVTDKKIVKFADYAAAVRRKPRRVKDDADEREWRRGIARFVTQVKREALQTKDEGLRVRAVQILAAMTLVQYLAEHDLGHKAA